MADTAEQKAEIGEDYRKVMQAVRDFIFDQHHFPQINDIVDITGIQRPRCNEVVDQLVRQKRLYVAFEGEGKKRGGGTGAGGPARKSIELNLKVAIQ